MRYLYRIHQLIKPRLRNLTCLQKHMSSNYWYSENTKSYGDRTALIESSNKYTYNDILELSLRFSSILKNARSKDFENRVIFHYNKSAKFLVTLLACWLNGYVAVPVLDTDEIRLLKFVEHSKCSLITAPTDSVLQKVSEKLKISYIDLNFDNLESNQDVNALLEEWIESFKTPALLLYTANSYLPESSFKNYLHHHEMIVKQINWLKNLLKLRSNDIILSSLPLSHFSGILMGLLTPFIAGVPSIFINQKDSVYEVWNYLSGLDSNGTQPTVFIGTPDIYAGLARQFKDKLGKYYQLKDFIQGHLSQNMRLMISCGSPLPESISSKWKDISGHNILDCYGTNETGFVAASQSGKCLNYIIPGIQVRVSTLNAYSSKGYSVVAEGSSDVPVTIKGDASKIGEFLIRNDDSSFKSNNSVTKDGWFKTGDAVLCDEIGYKILGKKSTDVFKNGAFNVISLELESRLLSHPLVQDCAVVGLPDPNWHTKIVAVVVLKHYKVSYERLSLPDLRKWCSKELALTNSIPEEMFVFKNIPRNITGAVNKIAIINSLLNGTWKENFSSSEVCN